MSKKYIEDYKPCVKFDEKQLPYMELGDGSVVRLERYVEPDEKTKEKAKRELRETDDVKEKAMNELRALIAKENGLHLPTDEEYMVMFLRPCKFYPDSCMKRIKNFYNLKYKYGIVCDEITPNNCRQVFEKELISLIPYRDPEGRRVMFIEAGKKWKPSQVPLEEIFKAVQLLVLASMAEPMTQINGAVVVIDMLDLPLSHVVQFTPHFAAMILEYVQDCILMRLKAVHIVNNSYIFNMIFAIFKPFIREKLRKRIFFHGKDMKSFHKHIPRDILPPKYDGTFDVPLPPGKIAAEMFDAYKKEFDLINTYGYAEDRKKLKS
ncbi:alpha-tocopherol transfer protein-like [Condylostylus longicornis]|uniref:alpha-tocopherol transfer protein-like n=1 Tax=Condylostylus longicornis TaxID=2530218 RepID=UPI00244E38C1|nr:alpha-tocopherol transfer protein-like [Condylostylus longicornis]XP_055382742.1 alpha-tocopherol transfer protein-like [Condylostylus longicornis]XP_055382743.1 alpha-tocopherol transfer protein-like [Condylostylus longicornis]XP_055382744.1 alpha-tocopherol transfer protein-like [Condylostylus longicornis]